ncbi:hypothetical protein C0993_004411 [Termitomyces sp. T159_Od127]|nr:hypothetical protein C0993_004411 [Termitomyces sp. T159_Od127]
MFSLHVLFLLFALAVAIPSFDGTVRQSTISSLVGPTAAYIEALPLAPKDTGTERRVHHLGLDPLGQPGNLTIVSDMQSLPLFYVYHNQLWQFNNETSILRVNSINSTEATGYPIQLIAGSRAAGSKDGSWRWRGTMLYYDQGSLGNSGLYYHCRLADGTYGLFMFLRP